MYPVYYSLANLRHPCYRPVTMLLILCYCREKLSKLARLRRDPSVAQVAERATCLSLTVARIEKGAATVAIGIYLRVLYALLLDDDILHLAQKDELGHRLQDLSLIKNRERASKKR